jgi:uncharacterized membrane protein YfcA
MPLFENLDLATLALIAAIAYASAVFHSVGGFAGGLLLTIGLAPVLGVKETIPVASVALIVSNLTRVWVFRRWIPWPEALAIFTAALPGVILGAVLYIKLPVHYVALVLGLFLIVTVPLRRYVAHHDFKVSVNGLRAVAVPYGLVAGTVVGAGMMLGPFLLGAGIVGVRLVALIAALGLGLNMTKGVVFGASPLLDLGLAAKGLMIGFCAMPGAFTGRWIVTNTPIRVHTVFMECFILCGAGYFLWRAAEGLL